VPADDSDGYLWIPAAQLNRTPELAGGKQSVDYPVWIYKLRIPERQRP
jgi:hypothetical protein